MKAKVVEVGPRDGFQNVKSFIPTENKIKIIDGLVKAGIKKIQITSFVSEKAIPQMRDAPRIAEAVLGAYEGVDFLPWYQTSMGPKQLWLQDLRRYPLLYP